MDHLDALIFIDTNILLDFYRVRSGGVGLVLLDKISEHHDRIITGSQVEMEYKKNRQRVILESLNRLKTPDWSGLTPPAFLSDAQPAKVIASSKSEISKQQSKLKRRIEAILRNPAQHDPVYKQSQRLFKTKSQFNLSRENKIRYKIRSLARKRFILGYPPRKQQDTSIGDAINWEWLIYCAEKTDKHIIIVTRDSDYGVNYGGEMILNDWLAQEFKQRINRRRKLLITDRLAQAFKLVAIAVSKAEEEEEASLLAERKVEPKDLEEEFMI
jgi:PIN domain